MPYQVRSRIFVAKTKNTTDCLIAGTARAIARPKKQICKDEFTLYWVQILISLLVIAIFAGAAALWDDDNLPWRKPRSQPKKWLTPLLACLPNASNATLYENLKFNFIRDIAPIAGIARDP